MLISDKIYKEHRLNSWAWEIAFGNILDKPGQMLLLFSDVNIWFPKMWSLNIEEQIMKVLREDLFLEE